ncbi:hypothetical protein ASC84_19950 [Acinetobacter sp. Root1280]|uniref:hypothetical protein n=1 Tax=Acinetobacter sp. Root1280 TaxID=1736444 RepID=UPI0006F63DA6|nr:hypothetical protein [Acinetobacter sp. Root1280]KQW99765.1 hypothetical protein ASC84_19950 [Acinetobacter sp. Root1280]
MLPLLNNEIIYITLSLEKCLWLVKKGKKIVSGDFEIDYQQSNWVDILSNQIKVIAPNQRRINFTIESIFCRFILLPPQKYWPKNQVLKFLAINQFDTIYPNFDSGKYVYIFDKIEFDEKIFCMAIYKNIYDGVIKLKDEFNHVFFNTSLGNLLSFNKVKDENIKFTEHNLIYFIEMKKSRICSITTFPKNIISNSEKYLSFEDIIPSYNVDRFYFNKDFENCDNNVVYLNNSAKEKVKKILFIIIILLFIFLIMITVFLKFKLHQEKQEYEGNYVNSSNEKVVYDNIQNYSEANIQTILIIDKVMGLKDNKINFNKIDFENNIYNINGEVSNTITFNSMIKRGEVEKINFLINDISNNFDDDKIVFDLKVKNE